jgi:hypothetical protein
MQQLYLGDLSGYSEQEIKEHIAASYAGEVSHFDYGDPSDAEKAALLQELGDFSILLAYESVGSWGCDSSSYFLMRKLATGELFEFSGGHCSCYGFEGQYSPEPVSVEYLKSDRFHMGTGGYDEEAEANEKAAKQFMQSL